VETSNEQITTMSETIGSSTSEMGSVRLQRISIEWQKEEYVMVHSTAALMHWHQTSHYSLKVLSRVLVTIRWGMNCWMYLLATYTHHSELQVITAPPLISTIYSSLQHPLSLSQPTVSSTAVPWQRLLRAEILQLPELTSFLHRLSFRNTWQLFPLESGSGSELLYDRPFTDNQFVLAPRPLRPTTSIFFFQLNTCDYNPFVSQSQSYFTTGGLTPVCLGVKPLETHDQRFFSPTEPLRY
jgi:hypothetical protein